MHQSQVTPGMPLSPELVEKLNSGTTEIETYFKDTLPNLRAKAERLQAFKSFPDLVRQVGVHRFMRGFVPDIKMVGHAVQVYALARPFHLDDAILDKMSGLFDLERKGEYAWASESQLEQYQVSPLPLPFNVCWFEGLDAFLARGVVGTPGTPEMSELCIAGMLALNGPVAVHMMSLVTVMRTGQPPDLKIVASAIPYDSTALSSPMLQQAKGVDFVGQMAYRFLRRFLDFQRANCSQASVKINHKFKTGVGDGRKLVRIRDSVDVILKGDRKKYEARVGKAIDWSHRWEVMGHWRKHDGTGKDQFGNYCIEGFTWVSPHEKGPDGKELVVKSRNVIGGEAVQ